MNAEQEMIRLGADELYGENYVTTAWHAERTFYNTLGVAKWCMSRRVRECGYKTVITGEGSETWPRMEKSAVAARLAERIAAALA